VANLKEREAGEFLTLSLSSDEVGVKDGFGLSDAVDSWPWQAPSQYRAISLLLFRFNALSALNRYGIVTTALPQRTGIAAS